MILNGRLIYQLNEVNEMRRLHFLVTLSALKELNKYLPAQYCNRYFFLYLQMQQTFLNNFIDSHY